MSLNKPPGAYLSETILCVGAYSRGGFINIDMHKFHIHQENNFNLQMIKKEETRKVTTSLNKINNKRAAFHQLLKAITLLFQPKLID